MRWSRSGDAGIFGRGLEEEEQPDKETETD